MRCRMSMRRTVLAATTVALVLAVAGPTQAQQVAGVAVDADGVLRKQVFPDPTGELSRERIRAARATLDPALAASSPLRKVSLTRLEQAVAARLSQGLPISDEMRYLAGVTRLKYVFVYPESGDVVIAGPAEGWVSDLSGRVRGLESGQPVLELDDLIVALRMYRPGGDGGSTVGCSIDPTPEGLAAMQQFLQDFGGRATPADTEYIVDRLRSSMGMQSVRVFGVPATTHLAQVMVEADYRMKLIGIGLEQPPIKLASYVDRANAGQVARNALERWYFVPDYDCVRASDDALAVELVGDGVKLVGEQEAVGGAGERRRAASTNRASQSFVRDFTAQYGKLARVSPVFAQLRNAIDMLVAAAYIQHEDFYGRAGWDMKTFGDESALPVETMPAPGQVETVVTGVWRGNRLMTPVGGGVTIQADQALADEHLRVDDGKALRNAYQHAVIDLKDGQWWWD